MKLIINADDYGMDENRTRAIQECFKRGLITQTTIMVNMPWADRAVDAARQQGISGKIGLHLNFTEGVPLTEDMRKCPIFCNAEGRYTGRWHNSKFRRFVMSSSARQAIVVEARAQMEKYLTYGLPLLHLDSHHHSHTDYVVAKNVLPMAKNLGFKSVRLSRNLGRSMGMVKKAYKRWFNAFVKQLGFKCADYFCGFEPEELSRGKNSTAVVEMMTHPFFYKGKQANMMGELGDGCRPISSLSDFVESLPENTHLCTYFMI